MQTISFQEQTITPSKVVCIGRNYLEHIKELKNEVSKKVLKEMVIFSKPNSAITDTLYAIDHCHYEAELCFLIWNGKFKALGFGLDLTKRALQQKLKEAGHPWERAKAFNHSAVFSSFISPFLSLDVPINKETINLLRIALYINDKQIQQGSVTNMLHHPTEILTEIQSFMHLENGDILMTGTPKGVGEYQKGDVFLGQIWMGKKLLLEKKWTAL